MTNREAWNPPPPRTERVKQADLVGSVVALIGWGAPEQVKMKDGELRRRVLCRWLIVFEAGSGKQSVYPDWACWSEPVLDQLAQMPGGVAVGRWTRPGQGYELKPLAAGSPLFPKVEAAIAEFLPDAGSPPAPSEAVAEADDEGF